MPPITIHDAIVRTSLLGILDQLNNSMDTSDKEGARHMLPWRLLNSMFKFNDGRAARHRASHESL